MDLRRFTLILLGIAGAAALRGAAIQTYPLDERLVYTGSTGMLAFAGRYDLSRLHEGDAGFRGESDERTTLSYTMSYRLNGVGAWLIAVPLFGLPLLQVAHAERAFLGTMKDVARAAERLEERG